MKKFILLLIFTVYAVNAYSKEYYFSDEKGKGKDCTITNPCSSYYLVEIRKKYNFNDGDRAFFQVHDKWLFDPTIEYTPKKSILEKISEAWNKLLHNQKTSY